MGSNKGQSSQAQNTSQTSTYSPAGAGYVGAALGRAADAANNPFAIPQAPVAGFSQDQQGAFQQYRDAQGSAQPYYNMASNAYSPQGTQDYYNPYAANVMANMKDIFGEQMTKNDSNLTQAAGGVGADRIAVGHAALAKQQDLAAGQTMADLWGRAGTQAMQAGQGFQNLGNNVQNSQLQGTNALLQSGGLQQQLSQAQMNSPYQQQLAMAAFPYQQAQFLAGITGSLAPGLGGTTSGYGSQSGTATPAPPSIWSQLLGAGAAGLGAYKGLGGTGDGMNPFGSYDSYGGGNSWNSAYGGSASSPLPGLSASDYAARGGVINPYAEGGEVEERGHHIPFSDPIDISRQPIIPQAQLAPIQANIPQIDLRPQQQSQQQQSGSGFDLGSIMKTAAQLAPLLVQRGGRINPYAAGGRAYADRGRVPVEGTPYDDGQGPFRLDPQAMQDWRNDTPMPPDPGPATVGDGGPQVRPTAFAGPSTTPAGVAAIDRAAGPRAEPADASDGETAALGYQNVSPYSRSVPANPPPVIQARREQGFGDSPWAALMSAGLGMMAGTSPYAGVNIGTGAQQGLKTLQQQRENAQRDETHDQAARRLAQEAQFHEDAYKRMTKYQQETLNKESWSPAGTVQTKDGMHPLLVEGTTGKMIDGVTRKPPTESDTVIQKGGSKNSPEEIASVVDGIIDGSQPPSLTGLYGDSVHVRAGLKAKGFNLAKAQQEWDAAKKQVAAVNAPRMTAYVGLNKSVDRTIDEVRELSNEMKLGGIPFMNKLELQKYIQTQGNSDKGVLATRYMTAVNTLKEEFANLATGGYAPTEAAWKLANDQVNGNYGMKQLNGSIDEIQRLIRYRLNAVPNLATLGPSAPNRYNQSTPPAAAPAGATAPPPAGHGGGGKPDVTTRFNQLIGGGKTEEETYAILKEEGYQ